MTMPERVQKYLCAWEGGLLLIDEGFGPDVFVKHNDYAALESRLLAAEARVREVGQNAEQFRASMYALEERVLTLRAERDALVPLARVGIIAIESRGAAPIVVRGITDEQLTQARAILARSVDGGDHYGSRRHPDREPDQG